MTMLGRRDGTIAEIAQKSMPNLAEFAVNLGRTTKEIGGNVAADRS